MLYDVVGEYLSMRPRLSVCGAGSMPRTDLLSRCSKDPDMTVWMRGVDLESLLAAPPS